MNNAMNDAMDLYAWAVETCQAKGYPLRAVRVRWTTNAEHLRHYIEFDGARWHEDALSARDRQEQYGPEGVTLAIDEGEAEALGLPVTLERGRGGAQVVVRLQPSHGWRSSRPQEWIQEGVALIGFDVMCRRCGAMARFIYPDSTFEQLMKEYERTPYRTPPSTEGHLPACVIHHHVVVRASVGSMGQTAACTQCNKELPLPPQSAERGAHPAFDITEEYVRSLGRCRGRDK